MSHPSTWVVEGNDTRLNWQLDEKRIAKSYFKMSVALGCLSL